MLKTPFLRDRAAAGATPANDVEVELIRRIAAGDLASFEELYRCYYPRLRRFLDRMTRRHSLIEEVVDDTMLVVWNRPGAFNHTSKVSTWIFAIAYRTVLNALRRDDEPAGEPADDRACEDPGPEDALASAEIRGLVTHALQRLSPEHRAVLSLTYYNSLGCREIAAIMGCPVDTVKTRMFHARRRLRALLAGEREDWL
jgi:RNA polymerase sigma-70 factor (ECF subfamily)